MLHCWVNCQHLTVHQLTWKELIFSLKLIKYSVEEDKLILFLNAIAWCQNLSWIAQRFSLSCSVKTQSFYLFKQMH